jgi:hypothetical protein
MDLWDGASLVSTVITVSTGNGVEITTDVLTLET